MELLLAEEKYKVVGFDLEYTRARAGSRPKVAVAQMCVRHHVLVYHYCLATRPCECFTRFVNSPHYMFATVDITNDVKGSRIRASPARILSTSRANTRSGAARRMRRTHWFTSPMPSSTPTIETSRIPATRTSVPGTWPGWRNSTKLMSCMRPRRHTRATTCTGGSLT